MGSLTSSGSTCALENGEGGAELVGGGAERAAPRGVQPARAARAAQPRRVPHDAVQEGQAGHVRAARTRSVLVHLLVVSLLELTARMCSVRDTSRSSFDLYARPPVGISGTRTGTASSRPRSATWSPTRCSPTSCTEASGVRKWASSASSASRFTLQPIRSTRYEYRSTSA